MRRYLKVVAATAALLVALTSCRAKDERAKVDPDLFPERVVLPLTEAPNLLTGCDGNTIHADSLWSPRSAVLHAIDEELVGPLVGLSMTQVRENPLRAYHRQYMGLFRNGRALVFINGIHEDYLHSSVKDDGLSGSSPTERKQAVGRWFRTRAIRVCDGGSWFFRAEYDLVDKMLIRFTPNGQA